MKVGVYTIALNEEQFVKRWYESAKEADYLLIADTGSTDMTIETAKSLGINVVDISVKPWRFDVARNASLALLPADLDYCVALDMDEILIDGWRAELERALQQGSTRPRYQYTWSWKDEAKTIPGLQYGGDKIHSRFGYRWKHPVHEVLTGYGDSKELETWVGLEIHHYPDSSKSRSQYLPLLAQAVQEAPEDDRNAYYYARELYYYGRFDEALGAFKRHLSLPSAVWRPERAASMRYLAKLDKDSSEKWLLEAIKEAPGRREALVEYALYLYENSLWSKCLEVAKSAIAIKEKPLDYLCEDFAWGATPWDLAAIASYNLNDRQAALEYGKTAYELDKENERLKNNLKFYSQL
jgi:glycosyltransferase involved in cell wall biosynthesis